MTNTHSRNYWGTITARQGAVEPMPGGGNKGVASSITYDAESSDIPEGQNYAIKLTAHLPKRRISRGAKIIVSEVGDPCLIQVRGNEVFLWAITEGIPFKEACP